MPSNSEDAQGYLVNALVRREKREIKRKMADTQKDHLLKTYNKFSSVKFRVYFFLVL